MPIYHTIPLQRAAIQEAPLDISFTSLTAEATNTRLQKFQARNLLQGNLAVRTSLRFYLANSSLGRISGCGVSPTSGLIATNSTGRVLVFASTTLAPSVSSLATGRKQKAGIVTTNTLGIARVSIKTSRADNFFLTLVLPDGTLAISNAILFA